MQKDIIEMWLLWPCCRNHWRQSSSVRVIWWKSRRVNAIAAILQRENAN